MTKKSLFIAAFLLVVCCSFFYQVFLHGYLPFPGDLLMSENPYKADSVLGYPPGGVPNKAQDRDVFHELVPWKLFTISEMKRGELPLWNPYNFSGSIMMQNFQTGVFYPLNIFFFLFPFTSAWTLFILSQPIFASLFMFLFLKELHRSTFASVLGGIGFAFSSYMIVWMEYGNIDATFLWLPLLLLFLSRFLRKPSVGSAVGFILSATVSFSAGYIQGFFYEMVLCVLFGLFILAEKGQWKKALWGIPLFLVPIGLGAIQLLATYEVFSVSTRGSYSLSQIQFLLSPWYFLATMIAPDFFGNPATRTTFLPYTYIERVMYPGIVILLFAFYAFFAQKDRIKKFFFIIAGVVLLITLQLPGVAYLYRLPIPMISTSVPTRFLSLFLFCIVIVASYGADWFFQTKKIYSKFVVAIGFAFVLLWGVALLSSHFGWVSHTHVLLRGLIVPTILCVSFFGILAVARKFALLGKLGLIILLIVDLFFFFQKITPVTPYQFFYPQTNVFSYLKLHQGLNRFWGYGDGYVPPNIETANALYAPEGEDPLHIKWYGELLAASENGDLGIVIPRPDANIAPGFGTDDLKNNVYRKKLLDTLGVAYILNRSSSSTPDTDTFPLTQYSLLYRNANWQVYKNNNVLSRAFLSSDYQVVPDDALAIHAFYHDTNPRELILAQNPTLSVDQNASGTAQIVSYQPQRVVIQTNTSGNTLLFLSDAYYPSWQATVDGKEVPILRADVALRAVAIPGGVHTIVFRFVSHAVSIGLWIMLGTILAGLVYLGYIYKLVKSEK